MGRQTDARVNRSEARKEGGLGEQRRWSAMRMPREQGYGGERDLRRDVGA